MGAALALVGVLLLAACSPASRFDDDADGVTTVTLRLWDTQVAAAYERSFAAFSQANPDIRVELVQVPFTDYFTRCRWTSRPAPRPTSTGSTRRTSGRSPTPGD